MDDFTQNILLALLVLFVVHQISFRLLMDPAKYQERVTLRAVHRAFLDKPDKHHQPDALLPYRHNLNWDRLLNVYDLKLHRDAPRKFADLRSVWGIDEAEYTSEVRTHPSLFYALSVPRYEGHGRASVTRQASRARSSSTHATSTSCSSRLAAHSKTRSCTSTSSRPTLTTRTPTRALTSTA